MSDPQPPVDWEQVAENRKQVNVSRSRQIDELRDRLERAEALLREAQSRIPKSKAEHSGLHRRIDKYWSDD